MSVGVRERAACQHSLAGAFDKSQVAWMDGSDTAASTSVLIVIPNHVDPQVWLPWLVAGQIRPFGQEGGCKAGSVAIRAAGMRLLGCECEAGRAFAVAQGLCLHQENRVGFGSQPFSPSCVSSRSF